MFKQEGSLIFLLFSLNRIDLYFKAVMALEKLPNWFTYSHVRKIQTFCTSYSNIKFKLIQLIKNQVFRAFSAAVQTMGRYILFA